MNTACTYLMEDGVTECARQPVVVDVFVHDEITGSHWLASLCQRHWSRRTQSFALARGYAWADRENAPALEVVPA